MTARLLRLSLALCAVLAVVACGDAVAPYSLAADSNYPNSDNGSDAAEDSSGFGSASDVGSATPTEDAFLPEEPEEQAQVNRPTASRRYVFVANRSIDSVAKIDSETLAVTPIPVGREPAIVRTTSEGDTAIVLNVGSDSASIIEARSDIDYVDEVDIIPGCNSLVVAPDGEHAVAWYDNLAARPGDRIGELQEVSVIRIADAEVFDVSVGFNIRGVHFDTDGRRAFVVTDSGLNALELGALDGDIASPSVTFGDDPLVTDADREVGITEHGAYAVLRSSSFPGLRVVDLETEEAVSVALPGVPTDIDLLGDESTALVALRDVGRIAVLRLGAVIDDPTDVEFVDLEAPPGLIALADNQELAFSYTTLDDERRLTVLQLAGTVESEVFYLEKGIRSVLTGPNSQTAIVMHSSAPGVPVPGEPIETFVDKAEGVTLFDVRSGYSKLVLLDVEPDEIVFSPDGDDVFVMLADDATDTREVIWMQTDTFATRSIEMDAMPEALGVVPGTSRVFVSQQMETGRITFIDTETGDVQHVSAFQLNAFID